MKIGITSGGYIDCINDNIDYTEKVKIGTKKMKQHGYDCLDFQKLVDTENDLYALPNEKFRQVLIDSGNIARDNGIEISQTHGPWRYPIKDFTVEDRQERFENMSKAIVGTSLLGCKNFVVHYIMPFGNTSDGFDEMLDINLDYFSKLNKIAVDNGVVICLENMPFGVHRFARPKDTLELVKMFKSENIKMCLDTGHCACLNVAPGEAVRLIGKEYLSALHIHDSEVGKDRHWLPGEGIIDWENFGKALNEINFNGSASLETSAKADNEDELEKNRIALFEKINSIVNY